MGEGDSLVGRRLGPYRVDALLGEGAMGEVYRAEHEALARPVAIKTLKPHVAADRSLMERFFAEARAVNIIRHENIVECTDLVNQPGATSYIVMELLEGTTLAGAIRSAGRLPARRAARIAAQIADAIGAAHLKGIVHRDLKPENVFLIRRAGSNDYVKVLDFGIARLRPDIAGITATQSGAIIGTPAYMAPEQARGEKAGPAADQYAVGIMLFHMLTGRLPFAAPTLPQMLIAHQSEVPARVDAVVDGVPAALADAVARAVEKDPADRFPDLQAFRAAVLASVGLPVEASMVVTAAAGAGGSPSAFDDTMAPAAHRATAWQTGVGQSSVSGSAGEVATGASAAAPTAEPPASAGRGRMPLIAGGTAAAVAAIALTFIVARGGCQADGGGEPDAQAVAAPAGADAAVAPATAAGPATASPPAGPPGEAAGAAPQTEVAREDLVALSRFGFLSIDASAPATVYIDGKRIGATPLVRVPLRPGPYRVKLVGKRGATRELEVLIYGGRDTDQGVVDLRTAGARADKPAADRTRRVPDEPDPDPPAGGLARRCPEGQTWDAARGTCRKPDLTRELVE